MQDQNDKVLASLVQPGIRVSKLKLHDFAKTGRGLSATAPIRNHEILLTIPPKYLLNLKVIGKEFNFDWRKPPVPAHVALAVYMLHHRRRSESPLKAYIESLPTFFETIPLVWSENLVKLLPESTKTYLQKQQTVFDKHYIAAQQFCRDYLENEESFSRAEFQWAWLVVNSRCIYQELSPTSTRDDNYACSPLIDMINHVPSSVPHCKLSYDIKGLSVISQSSYRAGEETFISYGAHSNEALLCEYGFVIPGNTDNCITIDHEMSAILRPHHQRLLMELGYYEDYTISQAGDISFRTEVALRTALLSEEDCLEGTTNCRRLTQFVNGQCNGSRDQRDIDALLEKVLIEAMKHSEAALRQCDCSDTNEQLIARLWRDRVDIFDLALRHLRH